MHVFLDEYEIILMDSIQQENHYDCGIHVMCNVDVIVKHFLKNNIILLKCPSASICTVKKKRNNLLSIIKKLKSQS